jgi:outer membrane beta-barrel protein
METRLRILLLSVVLAALPGCATVRHWFHGDHPATPETAQAEDENAAPPRVVDPEVSRRKITVPKIRSRNIEVGLDYGVLSIEDFGTHPSYGLTAAYHITEDFFFQAEVGRARAGNTSFETLSGISLLTDSERRFTYYDLSLGYNFLPGEAFIGRGHALTSAFYLIGGIGGTDFAGDTKFTVNFGAGYRVVPTDWLAFHITVQDRVFQTDLFGTSKLTNNIEARIGTTVFF